MIDKCICEIEEFERDTLLYLLNRWEAGYDFKQIKIKFCPVCGKRLTSECDNCPTPEDCQLCRNR